MAELAGIINAKETKPTKEKVATVVKEKVKESINFLIIWTAVGWYYFFFGLYMVIHKKLPRGWKPITEKEIAKVVSNIQDFNINRKISKKYGRVVDLDKEVRAIDLMKDN